MSNCCSYSCPQLTIRLRDPYQGCLCTYPCPSFPRAASHNPSSIPGPIEVTDEVLLPRRVTRMSTHRANQVLYANAHPSMSHVSADFIPVFGDCIRMLRELLFTQDAQPFLIAGSGTLGWDQVRVILAGGELGYGPHIGPMTRSLPTSLSPARTRLSSTAVTSAIVSPTGKSDYARRRWQVFMCAIACALMARR